LLKLFNNNMTQRLFPKRFLGILLGCRVDHPQPAPCNFLRDSLPPAYEHSKCKQATLTVTPTTPVANQSFTFDIQLSGYPNANFSLTMYTILGTGYNPISNCPYEWDNEALAYAGRVTGQLDGSGGASVMKPNGLPAGYYWVYLDITHTPNGVGPGGNWCWHLGVKPSTAVSEFSVNIVVFSFLALALSLFILRRKR